MKQKQIIIFGGSFDPIHLGHLAIARHLQNLGFRQIIFLPCGIPALKKATAASADDRVAMLKLALNNHTGFSIDERELQRPDVSYAIDTLKSFRQEYGAKASISFVIGQDAFANLMKWHQWQDLLNYAHIINHSRPNLAHAYPEKLQEYLKIHQCQDLNTLQQTAFGHIFCLQLPNYPYSSTAIRQDIEKGIIPKGLNPKVWQYIQNHRLYGFKLS